VRTFKLTVAYDGTDFVGWQRQARDRSVQAAIEDVLMTIEGAPVAIVGAGRTDAGVHAAAQVASVSLQRAIPSDELHRALNATLPGDVRVLQIEDVASGFNARFHAKAKVYRYWMWNGAAMLPALRRFAWHIPQSLDSHAMQRAADLLIGEHDFSAFQAARSDVKTTKRTLTRSALTESRPDGPMSTATAGALLCYEVTGSGFLRHMVRNIVGTLIDVGRGRLAPEELTRIVASRDRAEAGPTAPPHGLTLWRVEY
jgi:tRNA pseudouridine38-40 synthase